jgi:hypothetical protein
MAKITRYSGNLKAFASEATGTNRTVFGEVTQANDLTSQITTDFLQGWQIVGPSDQPTLQDFNALGYTAGQLLAYLHQVGVAEYNAAQEYHTNSLANLGGAIYTSLIDNNVGNAPASSPTQWEKTTRVQGLPSAVNGGTANALTADFTPDVALVNGATILVRANAANTSLTPTLAVDGAAPKTITKQGSTALAVDDIKGAGHWLILTLDTVLDRWVLANPSLTAAEFLNTTRIDVASASTVNLTTAAPNIRITGAVAITGFTVAIGQTYIVSFSGAATLTNNAAIVTNNGANIIVTAGDSCIIRATAANVVEIVCGEFLADQGFGFGQTWQNVSGSRAANVTYTNSTNKPIEVSFRIISSSSSTISFTVAGNSIPSTSSTGSFSTVNFIVPIGATYLIAYTNAASFIWAELR